MICELLIAASTVAAPAKVGSITLAELVREADAIVVARVVGDVVLPLAEAAKAEHWKLQTACDLVWRSPSAG